MISLPRFLVLTLLIRRLSTLSVGRALLLSVAATGPVSEGMLAQNFNVTHRATMTFPNQNLANVWGYTASNGKEYALVGGANGLIIVDVTNPDTPQFIKQIPGPTSSWREIKTYQHYAYVVTEHGNIGIQVVNLSNLPDTNITYHNVNPGGITKGHALHVDETKGYLYVYGSNLNGGRAQVFNLNTDPYNPSYVGHVPFIGYVHDGYVDNDTLFSAHIYAGKFAIINMANKSNPILLGSKTTPGAFTHNTWRSGNYLFTTDEVSNSFLTSYDISDPTDIREKDRIAITPGSGSIVHNTHVINDYAVTSWYKDGFSIIDVSRPDNMIEVGRYDTYPQGSGSGFEGCWGVYPYFPSGTIVASNIRAYGTQNGELWVMTPTYQRGCYLEGTVTDSVTGNPLPNATVTILSTGVSGTTNAAGEYKIGQVQSGTFNVSFSKPGYVTKVLSAALSNGVVTILNAALAPTSGGPGSPLATELVAFEARREGRKALLHWQTAFEKDQVGFAIQHSRNGGHHWNEVGFVAGRGNSQQTQTYDFEVDNLTAGAHLFRLRQTDQTGQEFFSPWRSVFIPAEKMEVTVWPNPVGSWARLFLQVPEPAEVHIQVLNADGRPTEISQRLFVEYGTTAHLPVEQLPPGTYFVQIATSADRQTVVFSKY
ncbi:MAG: choice-of-anchor B family protein [Saprospiraceae bacterium]|nr:choice-of-anchor B family protein [Saprospiraceae bacterium]MDW8485100.1 choice-of-anchor B family protein [Saprospiraceae bacterium]